MSSIHKNNIFKKILKNLDYFGVQINFKYKDEEKYRSIFGGIVFILFFGFSLTYILMNFQNFVDRKIMNLVYNEGFKEYAPEINFNNYSIKFAVGLDVGDPNFLPVVYKYLQIEFESIITKKENGVVFKSKTNIPLQPCNQSHFYDSFNSSFDSLGLNSLFCPDLRNVSVKGIYTDEEFRYFVFTVSLKKQWHNNTKEARKLFVDYEIKSIIYYIDTSISVWDYAIPIQTYLNNKFLTVDWQFFKKLNIDFMTLGFSSDDNILFRDEQMKELAVIDTYDQYFDHISEDRMVTKPRDYNSFAKIFVRSSTKNKVIKRIYMKVTEYLANMSSILSSILLIFYIIVSHLNNFKAKQSIIKKFLNYKENISFKNKEAMIHLKNKFNCSNDNMIQGDKEKNNIFSNFSHLNNKEIILNEKETEEMKKTNNYVTSTNNLNATSSIFIKEKDNELKSIIPGIICGEDDLKPNNDSNKLEPRFKRLSTFRVDSKKVQKENLKSMKFLKSLKMHFNVFEIINRTLCRCCLIKNQKLKNELYSYGLNKYNYHMSITSYLKKMHEIDLIKYLVLSEKQVDLFNFVSKPSVSLIGTNQLTESLIDKFNLQFNKDEIDKLFISFNELLDINNKSEIDNKLLKIVASEIDHLTI